MSESRWRLRMLAAFLFFIDKYQHILLTIINSIYILINVNRRDERGKKMATTVENNIRALEIVAEQLREEFNDAICMYELALEQPEYYDVESSKMDMDRCERFYHDALDEIEAERELMALGW